MKDNSQQEVHLLRTKSGQEEYDAFKKEADFRDGCRLCKADSIEEFEYWRAIKNRFPYDRIAETHNMIIPKRHIDEVGLTDEEKKELVELKRSYIEENYHFILEATTGIKSIPKHFHLHLITVKD